jgi:hypothetical protein
MGFKRALPGKKLFLRELVAAAGFLNSDHTGEHCRHDRCFAAYHPSLGGRRRKFMSWKFIARHWYQVDWLLGPALRETCWLPARAI